MEAIDGRGNVWTKFDDAEFPWHITKLTTDPDWSTTAGWHSGRARNLQTIEMMFGAVVVLDSEEE